MSRQGWIGVDLDGTLAFYDQWNDGAIGDPIPHMRCIVLSHLSAGQRVKIFTARAHEATPREIGLIQDWTEKHLGQRLEVTCTKDRWMELLYDDRAIAVQKNTGRLAGFHA